MKAWPRALGPLAGVLIVLLPCLPLLVPGDGFYSDWYNHLWQFAYFGEHLKRHGSLPIVLNTVTDGGLATPIFYGYLFYPLGGLLTTLIGPALALRLLVVGAFSLEYVLTASTARLLGASPFFARTLGALLVWAIYPLTNLYNRAAIPEFFAVVLLTASVFLWFRCLLAGTAARRWMLGSWFALAFCLAFGVHPITGMLGSLFILPLMLVSTLVRRSWSSFWTAAVFALPFVAVLLPWLLALSWEGSKLLISQYSTLQWIFYPTIDTPLVRLFPYDARVAPGVPLDAISTPFLDATFNGALLIVFVITCLTIGKTVDEKRRNRVVIPAAIVGLEVFLFFLFASLDPGLAEALPSFLRRAQFGYRLVTYQDLSLLCALIFVLYWYGRTFELPRWALIASLALSGSYLAIKGTHVEAVRVKGGELKVASHLVELPVTFNGFPDYQEGTIYDQLEERPGRVRDVVFTPGEGAHFGEWSPVSVKLDKGGWVGTNLQPFAWTRLRLDGREVEAANLRAFMVKRPEMAEGPLNFNHAFVAVKMPAGAHELSAHVLAPESWRQGRTAALSLLALWGALTLGATVFLARTRSRGGLRET